MPKRKPTSAPAAPPPSKKPVGQRGALWQAEKLTGNRAQKGLLPSGEPRWTCAAATAR